MPTRRRRNRGLEALRRYHEGFSTWFAGFDQIEIVQLLADADRIASHVLLRAYHKPTDRHVSMVTIRIDRIVDGKIAEHWSIADAAGLAAQLG